MNTCAVLLVVCSAMVYAVFLRAFTVGLRDLRRRRARLAHATDPGGSPAGVTILKPCAGVDDAFERCIESYFALRDANFEIVFGVRDPEDPALAVIQRVRARHPSVQVQVVVTDTPWFASPKISNMAGMARKARHALFWLSDSNTLVSPDTLGGMRAALARPGVGMVVSPIAAVGETTAGSALDNLEVNSWVLFGTIAIHDCTGLIAGPGKSMLIHRQTLARAGGWRMLGAYFGEDTVLMSAVRGLGLRLALGPDVVFHPNERTSLEAFAARHLRWLLIRLRLYPMSIVGELLMSPWLLSLAAGGYLARQGLWSHGAYTVLFGGLAQAAGDLYTSSRARGVRVPWRLAPLVWVRPLVICALALRAVVRANVSWRGNVAWVGRGSAILLQQPDTIPQRVSRWLRAVPPSTSMHDAPGDELLGSEQASRTSASAVRS